MKWSGQFGKMAVAFGKHISAKRGAEAASFCHRNEL
jgi:hypothetical protein